MSGTRISSWHEVRAHLAAIYADLRGEGDGPLEITVPMPASGTSGTPGTPGAGFPPQALRVQKVAAEGADWVEVLGVMGSARNVSHVSPLANNSTSAIGMCGATEGRFAMRQILPLAGLRTEDLDETIEAIAYQCAWGGRVLGEPEP